jgi:hypothetical protein
MIKVFDVAMKAVVCCFCLSLAMAVLGGLLLAPLLTVLFLTLTFPLILALILQVREMFFVDTSEWEWRGYTV